MEKFGDFWPNVEGKWKNSGSSSHVENKTSKTTALESDIPKDVLLKHNFSLWSHPHFCQR